MILKNKTLLALLSTFVLVLSFEAHAQDLIITRSNDSLRVKVKQLSEKNVHFRFEGQKDGAVLVMPSKRIRSLQSPTIGNHDFTYGNPRLKKPLSLFVQVSLIDDIFYLFPSLGCSYFVHENINIEAVAGMSDAGQLTMSIGSQFHLKSKYSKTPFSPFVGIQAGTTQQEDFIGIPIGLLYAGHSGFTASLSVGRRYEFADNDFSFFRNASLGYVEFRFGWRL